MPFLKIHKSSFDILPVLTIIKDLFDICHFLKNQNGFFDICSFLSKINLIFSGISFFFFYKTFALKITSVNIWVVKKKKLKIGVKNNLKYYFIFYFFVLNRNIYKITLVKKCLLNYSSK